MSRRSESPIFTRLQDLLRWTLGATRKFARDQRFALAQRLVDRAFELEDALVAASVDRSQASRHLLRAEIRLNTLRRGFLLAFEMKLITDRQLRHVGSLMQEIGRLLGGWIKKTRHLEGRSDPEAKSRGAAPQ